MKENAKVVRSNPVECIQQRTAGEIAEVPVAQIQDRIIHVGTVIPQRPAFELVVEQIMGLPVGGSRRA